VASGALDDEPVPYRARRLIVRTERIGSLLGTKLEDAEVGSLLAPLGFGTELPSGSSPEGVLDIVVPSFRPDVRREVDVAEEVARRLGYQELPTTERRSPYVGRLTDMQVLRRRLKRILSGLGGYEAWTMSIVDARDQERGGVAGPLVTLLNPMVTEESALRGGLLPGLLGAARHNLGRRQPWLRLFEIGDVFALPSEAPVDGSVVGSQDPGSAISDPALPDERELVGLLLADVDDDARSAMNAWRVISDALRLEPVEIRPAVIAGLHPTRTAEIVAEGIVIGVVGEVDPETLQAFDLVHSRTGWLELELSKLSGAPRRPLAAGPISRFPSSDVDLAFVVDDSVPAASVEVTLADAAGDLCESVELFDVYRGAGVSEGSRSLAYRLRFCALDRTLTDGEIAELRAQCITAVEGQFQATLRS
jgi:phenylalanyl-tRNA synthetase beta chain